MNITKIILRNPLPVQGDNVSVDSAESVELDASIDIGSAQFVLPASAVETLRLPRMQKSRFCAVELEINGKKGIFEALIEPKRTHAVIGSAVMATLDIERRN